MGGYLDNLQQFLDTLDLVESRDDRIELLIGTAERFKDVPEHIATRPYPRERLVPNCESEAYFWAEDRPDGAVDLHYAVENPQGISAKAMAVILQETLSGRPLEQIVKLSTDLPYEIFGRELSMGKSMGLTGMIAMAQQVARDRLAQRK